MQSPVRRWGNTVLDPMEDRSVEPVVALATDDGLHWTEGHFGDAAFYELYRLGTKEATFIARVENGVEEERMHGDPRKAQGIAALLKPYGVHALAGPRFGPNIARIRAHFVPIVIETPTLRDALPKLLAVRPQIVAEWDRAGMRKAVMVR